MITISTYRRNYEDEEGTSWARLDEAEAYSQAAADLAARTLLNDAVQSGRRLEDLAVLVEDRTLTVAPSFVPAEEYLAGRPTVAGLA